MSEIREQADRALYEIRVRGHLDEGRRLWFDGISIQPLAGDETSIWGIVRDQSALYALICKVRDLGLVLLSVRRLEG